MILHLKNVIKQFPSFKLGPIDLIVQEDTILVLAGPTGSGKTTILNLISGLIRPDNGSVFINNIDITKLPVHSRNIGYVFQNPGLFPHMSVYKNIIFGLGKNKNKKNEKEEQIMNLINFFGISHLIDRNVEGLSAGEMQKVSLVRMLATRPKLMLMDEPLAHLDNQAKKKIRIDLRRILKEQKIPCIYVTHFHEDIYALADSVAIIDNGIIKKSGRLDSLLPNIHDNIDPPSSTSFLPQDIHVKSNYNYLEGKVADSKNGITIFSIGKHKFEILGTYPLNYRVGILIKPEDIILSTENTKTSARNTIRIRVIKTTILEKGIVHVHLGTDDIYLISKITNESKDYLGIKEGDMIFAIFKATSPVVIREDYNDQNKNHNRL